MQRSRPNALRSTQRFLIYLVYLKLFWRTLYFVIKKIHTGPWRNLLLSRRNLTIYSRQLGIRHPFAKNHFVLTPAYRYTKALESIKTLRKERIAELKTDKERLDSLSREKGHADKLKARIADLTSSISLKEIDHAKLGEESDRLVQSNKQFYDSSTKFREMYVAVEFLQQNSQKLQEQIDDMKQNLQEVPGKSP